MVAPSTAVTASLVEPVTAAVVAAVVVSFVYVAGQMAGVGVVFYVLLGMFMDVLSMQVATIPITYPIAMALGVDPIWYGIFIVLMCELGLITPPVGLNLYVLKGVAPELSLGTILKGSMPFVVLMLLSMVMMSEEPRTHVPAGYSRNWTVVGHVRPAPEVVESRSCQLYTNWGWIPRERNQLSICESVTASTLRRPALMWKPPPGT